MSKLSTTLTVKNGSTTKTVNLYSSTSDMSNSSYTNEYLTCKCNGSTAYIAVASSGTDAYTNNGTALKYKNSSGTIKYILTEPYLPSTPSYSGTITIPKQTFYTNSTNSDYIESDNKENNYWCSDGFYLNVGDKVVIPQTSTFSCKEGTSQYSSGSTSIEESHYTGLLYIGTQAYYNGNLARLECYISGGGDGNEGGTKSYNQTQATYTVTSAGTYYISVATRGLNLRQRAAAGWANDVTIQIN